MENEIALALNRIADAINSLGATVGVLGFLFLIFKQMGGHRNINITHLNKDKKNEA